MCCCVETVQHTETETSELKLQAPMNGPSYSASVRCAGSSPVDAAVYFHDRWTLHAEVRLNSLHGVHSVGNH